MQSTTLVAQQPFFEVHHFVGKPVMVVTTNYQATYNRPGNNHHLAKVSMRKQETLLEYTNRFFDNHNTLAGVKDEDVIVSYKKGVTNLKLFEKIHEAGAHNITDLMAYDDKLVNSRDAVVHDFKGDKANNTLSPDVVCRSPK
jgi:hypothetical protein